MPGTCHSPCCQGSVQKGCHGQPCLCLHLVPCQKEPTLCSLNGSHLEHIKSMLLSVLPIWITCCAKHVQERDAPNAQHTCNYVYKH